MFLKNNYPNYRKKHGKKWIKGKKEKVKVKINKTKKERKNEIDKICIWTLLNKIF